MKATGIVRRIDDLGRVVIPKEIRRTMRIREGDPLEIYTEKDGEVIFKKYSPIGELGDFAANYVETLAKASGHGACITDRDNVIAVSGLPKKELIEKPVSSELENVMNEKIIVSYKDGKPVSVADGVEKYNAGVVVPIVSEGDTIGSVLFILKDGETAVDLPCQTLLRDESGRCLCLDHSGALPAEPGAGQTNGGGGEHRRNVELRKRNQVWKISAGNGKTESGTGRQYDPGKRAPCADETEPLFSCMPGSLFI